MRKSRHSGALGNLASEFSQMVDIDLWIQQEVVEKRTESPIEQAFCHAMLLLCQYRFGGIDFTYQRRSFESVCEIGALGRLFAPQVQIGDYRLDFLYVEDVGAQVVKIAIECDGHDFHQKTREQAARDKERDRYISTKCDAVLRFTGSEIYKKPLECAEETLKMVDHIIERTPSIAQRIYVKSVLTDVLEKIMDGDE